MNALDATIVVLAIMAPVLAAALAVAMWRERHAGRRP